MEERNVNLIRSIEEVFDAYDPELVFAAIKRTDLAALGAFSENMSFDFVYRYDERYPAQTPVVYAIKSHNGRFGSYAEDAKRIMEFLTANGGSLNRGSPLLHAAVYHHWPAAEFLLSSGVDPAHAGFFEATGYFAGERNVRTWMRPIDAAVEENHIRVINGLNLLQFTSDPTGKELAVRKDASGGPMTHKYWFLPDGELIRKTGDFLGTGTWYVEPTDGKISIVTKLERNNRAMLSDDSYVYAIGAIPEEYESLIMSDIAEGDSKVRLLSDEEVYSMRSRIEAEFSKASLRSMVAGRTLAWSTGVGSQTYLHFLDDGTFIREHIAPSHSNKYEIGSWEITTRIEVMNDSGVISTEITSATYQRFLPVQSDITFTVNDFGNYDYNEPIEKATLAELRAVVQPRAIYIYASSAIPDEARYSYGPDMAFDGVSSTAWNEGVDGSGAGEEIRIRFDRLIEADGIGLQGGYFDERWFSANNRVKRIRVELYDRDDQILTKSFDISDQMIEQRLSFPTTRFIEARFNVEDVYRGDRWNDLAVAEISFYTGDSSVGFTIPETSRRIVSAVNRPEMLTSAEKIVHVSESDGDPEIRIMNVDGTGARALTDNEANDVQPAWSAETGRIAFASNRDGNRFHIYTMNPDGTDVRLISDTTGDAEYMAPAWSPDGEFIGAVRRADRSKIDLVVFDVRGDTVAEAHDLNKRPLPIAYRWDMYGDEIGAALVDGIDLRWRDNDAADYSAIVIQD